MTKNNIGKAMTVLTGFIFTLNFGMILASVSVGYSAPYELILPAVLAIVYVVFGAYYNEFL